MRRIVKGKIEIFLVACTLTVGLFAAVVTIPMTAGATVLYVGGAGPGNHTTIQAAINAATTGDTIFVYSGTYNEKLSPNKRLTLLGEDNRTTIIDVGLNGNGIWLGAAPITVKGFTIKNAKGGMFDAAIYADGGGFNYIANNTFVDNNIGVRLHMSTNNVVVGNTFTNTSGPIYHFSSSNTNLSNNLITLSTSDVVHVQSSSNCMISGNKIINNSGQGILLWSSSNVNITDNIIAYNDDFGIEFLTSNNNVVRGNVIRDNAGGVNLRSSSANLIYHNDFVTNTPQANDNSGAGSWDDGYPSGGNYWSDWGGPDQFSGPSQDIPGSDGILDVSRPVTGGAGVDEYPLASPFNLPGSPRNLNAVAGNTQVALSWEAPATAGTSPIRRYTVYRGLSPGGETQLAALGVTLSYVDAAVTNGIRYYYRISASNAAGEGHYSAEVVATPRTAPGPPLDLAAVAGNRQVTLTWTAPPDDGGSPILNYSVFRGTTPGSEVFLVTLGLFALFTDTDLTNGVTYYYTVAAVNEAGYGPNSTEANATPATTPTEPLNLVATAGQNQITLTWTAPASDGGLPITHYLVYRGTASGAEVLLVTLGNALTYTDTAVSSGQTYYYKVTAMNAIGEGPESAEASGAASPPKGALSILEELWFWLAIALVVVVVAATVLFSRRKRGKKEAAESSVKEEEGAGEPAEHG